MFVPATARSMQKVKAKTKEVSYDEFIKAMYGELNH